MKKFGSTAIIATVAMGLIMAGCHKNVGAQSQANDLGPDPAAANMAPTDNGQQATDQGQPQQYAPTGQGTNEAITAARSASASDQQPAYQDQGYSDQSVDQGQDALDNGDYDDAEAQSDQAPPPLPEYSQPPIPDDGYLWTPGYWAWAPMGYYWVPGVWVMPPYQGALWTPSYWGFRNHHYYFYRGYWGHYIGYYGGINYGFGYGGRGYEGGYWRDNHFFYNRAVNNIRGPHITRVYVRSVTVANNNRVSYNGPGGANLRPAPSEFAAMRQARMQPMRTQMEAQHAASQNRQQFANVNRGRPAVVVSARPIQADRDTRPMPPARIPVQQARPGQQPQGFARPGQPQQQGRPWEQQNNGRPTPVQPGAVQQQRPGQPQPQQTGRPGEQQNVGRPGQPMNRPAPQQGQPQNFGRPTPATPAQQPVQTGRPGQQQQGQPQNSGRPAPATPVQSTPQQSRPTPQQTPQNFERHDARPQDFSRPAPAPQPQVRPEPQPRPAPAPVAPRPQPQARPAPQSHPAPAPAPQEKKDEHPH
jgi:hypothetical protein